jgi:hypothetical protein
LGDGRGLGGRVARGGEGLGGVRYPELTRFLLQLPSSQDRIALSLLKVQELLEEPLPLDAFLSSWWVNDPAVPHTRSWLIAGWEVEDMNPGRGVAFTRITDPN